MGKPAGKSGNKVLFWTTFAVVNAGLVFLLAEAMAKAMPELTEIKSTRLAGPAGALFTADLDGDNHDEIITIPVVANARDQRNVSAYSPFGMSGDKPFSYVWDNLLLPGEFVFVPQDVDGNEKPEAVLMRRTEEGIIFRTFNEKNTEAEFPLPFPGRPFGQETQLADPIFRDIDGDGAAEMIADLRTGFEKSPRGIVAYDLAERKLLWDFPTGCYPHQLAVADLDGDGSRPEIIFSGWAPHNDYAANGTNDDTSYLLILDAEGRLLDQEEMGRYYTKIFFDVGDVDGDGTPEIVTSRSCHRLEEPDPGEIGIYDWKRKTFRTRKSDPDAVFTNVFVFPTKEGDGPFLVVGDSQGRVTLFDNRLNIVRRIQLKPPAIVLGVGKLGSKTEANRIFVYSGFSEFNILSPNLKAEFRYAFKDASDISSLIYAPLSLDTISAGVFNADSLYLLTKDRITTEMRIAALWRSRAIPLALLFVLFNLLAVVARRARPAVEKEPHPIRPEAVQEIAHRMKNSLFTIGLEAERMRASLADAPSASPGDALQDGAASILEDVQKLKGATRTLTKMYESREPRLQSLALNGFLRELGERFRGLLEGKIEFVLDLEEEPLPARFDPTQLEEALSNIIENAVEALPGRGRITLSSSVIFSPGPKSRRTAEIDIEDDGRGIPEDKLAEIFKPYFTTKKDGSGIGLPIARRIIEAHGGRIEVQSRAGAGTRFAVYLPLTEK